MTKSDGDGLFFRFKPVPLNFICMTRLRAGMQVQDFERWPPVSASGLLSTSDDIAAASRVTFKAGDAFPKVDYIS